MWNTRNMWLFVASPKWTMSHHGKWGHSTQLIPLKVTTGGLQNNIVPLAPVPFAPLKEYPWVCDGSTLMVRKIKELYYADGEMQCQCSVVPLISWTNDYPDCLVYLQLKSAYKQPFFIKYCSYTSGWHLQDPFIYFYISSCFPDNQVHICFCLRMLLIKCPIFWAHLCVCTVGSYASLSVCLSGCDLTEIQTGPKVTCPKLFIRQFNLFAYDLTKILTGPKVTWQKII